MKQGAADVYRGLSQRQRAILEYTGPPKRRDNDHWLKPPPICDSGRDHLAVADEMRARVVQLCDMAWQAVYGEGRDDWDYPDMAIRHLIADRDEWKKKAEAHGE